ncbi:ZP domain-containing protein [Trichostrongylus colubriformis]|uniref:ZP domain-containing protein n=1 Tax=Trichostrongylus colubriformis TaxID=6319 RepID=A0AAN8G149_TRICO
MLLRLVTAIVWLLVSVRTAISEATDVNFGNALTEKPSIECGHGRLAVSISTEKQPPSHVFAKGHFNRPDCSFRNTTHVVFDFEKCDVNRKREVNPRGMAFSMTIVVQLHPLFITKVDRAFHVRCFYMEAEKAVGTQIGVNELTTSVVSGESEKPTCRYTLHKDSANGPLIKLAQVGDIIYHVWNCPSEVYGMMIHDCSIVDGQGNNHTVIDSDGCSTDTFLMPELMYSADLTTSFTAASAFNFPDQQSVYFNCQVRICYKLDEGCSSITPPRCGPMNSQDEVLASDLDSDQLFTSSSPSLATIAATSPTTTAAPTRIEETVATTTRPTTVYTTVTELTSTSAPTTSATLLSAAEFPTPDTLREYVRKNVDLHTGGTVTVDTHTEGSGLEILKSYRPTPVSLIRADHIPDHDDDAIESDVVQLKREMRRREAEAIDVDISSPELTIIDKDVAAELPEALHSQTSGAPGSAVCVPLVGFWLLAGLIVLCCSIIAASLCYAQKQRDKFHIMP